MLELLITYIKTSYHKIIYYLSINTKNEVGTYLLEPDR